MSDEKEQVSADAALVRQAGMEMTFGEQGVQMRTLAEVLAYGKAMIESGFVPKGFTRAAHVVWAVQSGAEVGLGPAASLRAFYVSPSGRPAFYAEAALALCVSKGVLDPDYDFEYSGEGDNLSCTFIFRRTNWKASKRVEFKMSEARTAGLIKDDSNWKKWPKRMVRSRAIGFALHDYFADVILGIPLEGEIDHLKPEDVSDVKPTVVLQAEEADKKVERVPTPDPLLDGIMDAEYVVLPPKEAKPEEPAAAPAPAPAPAEELPEACVGEAGCQNEADWLTENGKIVCSSCKTVIGDAQ